MNRLNNFPESVSAHRFGDVIHFAARHEIKYEDIQGFLADKGHNHIEINKITPNIEDCFMALMKNEN